MGIKFALTDTYTGSGLPVLYDDQIMSAGSLILNDVGHSLGLFSGVPANAGLIPNVAWKTANGLVSGAPGQSALSSIINTSGLGDATYPFSERTPKNGLHVIRSQANDVTSENYFMKGASSIATYMTSNLTHAFYWSVWFYTTRSATNGNSGISFINGNNTSNFFIACVTSGPSPSTGANLGHYQLLPNSSGVFPVGNQMLAQAVSGFTGTYSTDAGTIPFMWGGNGGPFNITVHTGPSEIFYRAYLEDVTVSAAAGGYAQGSAITAAARVAELMAMDEALQIAAFTTGGKFNGDSFTAPSSYP